VAQAGEVRDTLEALVAEGKLRSYGWSTDDPQRARLFADGTHCAAIQHAMNVLEDRPAMVTVCEQSNLASINRGPLAMGLLTGKYTASSKSLPLDDVRSERNPQWLQYFKHGKPHPDWLKKLDAVRDILCSNGRTLAQGALAWLWARTAQAIPIPGFRTVAQVDDNYGAIAHGALTAAQLDDIDRVLRPR
jgi:aryl-alcohol dehydrogenase-like predicted oxidoreductase